MAATKTPPLETDSTREKPRVATQRAKRRRLPGGWVCLRGRRGASVEELMAQRDGVWGVQGPDFPTGGIICGRHGILEGYRTGRGKAYVRCQHLQASACPTGPSPPASSLEVSYCWNSSWDTVGGPFAGMAVLAIPARALGGR